MKKISVLTLFDSVISNFINHSIIKRAIEDNKIEIEIINFRDYAKNKHKKVDDYQCGGGAGMVLLLQPIVDAIKAHSTKNTHIILLSPEGEVYNQSIAKKLVNTYDHIMLICGHYEGFDERIKNYVHQIISMGDYILTGGEIAALAIIDSITRLIDNVINIESLKQESFENNLLDYPAYTKPLDFEGYKIPEILMSGNHEKIALYRKEQQIINTKKYRLDLYKTYLKKEKIKCQKK